MENDVKKFKEFENKKLSVYFVFSDSHVSNIYLVGAYNEEDALNILIDEEYTDDGSEIVKIYLENNLQTTKHGFIRDCSEMMY